jgi:hypothetical protein
LVKLVSLYRHDGIMGEGSPAGERDQTPVCDRLLYGQQEKHSQHEIDGEHHLVTSECQGEFLENGIIGNFICLPGHYHAIYRKSDFTGTAHRRLQRVMWSD